jgi:hypothetical protein
MFYNNCYCPLKRELTVIFFLSKQYITFILTLQISVLYVTFTSIIRVS